MVLTKLNSLFAGLYAGAILAGSAALCQAGDVTWLTGDTLKAKLAEPAGGTWDGMPLRTAIAHFCKAQRVPFVLDRRIDPGTPLQLNIVATTPLNLAFEQLAQKANAGYALVGGVAYFGPAKTAERLRTVAHLRQEELNKLPATARGKYLRRKAWQWDDLRTPRELLTELGTEVNAKFLGGAAIPHDLWAAGDWPPLSWSERMTLVLAQYDLTYELDAEGQIKFVPLPDKPTITKFYPAPDNAREMLAKLMKVAPAAEIVQHGSQYQVNGTAEDHERVADRLASKSVPVIAKPVTKIDKFNVSEAPVGRLLKALGQRLDLDVQIDETAIQQAGLSLDTRVSVSAENITLEELFRRATKGTGLGYRIKGKTVEIFPAK